MGRAISFPHSDRHEALGDTGDLGFRHRGAIKQLLLRELSDLQAQVARLAKTIQSVEADTGIENNESSTCTEGFVRNMLKDRLDRGRFFPTHLFADPAWDMLLELYAAELGQRRVPVSSLCVASNVPSATAIRWINTLEREGLIERQPDPLDRRRFFLALSKKASNVFGEYFSTIAKRAAN